MKSNPCSECGKQVPASGGVHLVGYGFLCDRCYNLRITDGEYDHPSFEPIDVEDSRGVSRSFNIQVLHRGDLVSFEAKEARRDGSRGYRFVVLGDPAEDPMETFSALYRRVRAELAEPYLTEDRPPRIRDFNVAGRVSTQEPHRLPTCVIDGEEMTWEEVGRMVSSFEGWRFDLSFRSEDDDRRQE